ncbi:MAG: redox-sensing transcriptional repressor Rex [Victivallales bacterium]
MNSSSSVSIEMIRRLPKYYDVIDIAVKQGAKSISTSVIAEHLNLEPILVRKDLEQTGAKGRPRVGFEAVELMDRIAGFLGWGSLDNIVLVGCGSLGSALLGHKGFSRSGFDIVAGFDVDKEKIGRSIHGKKILPLSKLKDLCQRMHIEVGIISTPAEHAQSIADLMMESGIKGIWNFSGAPLKTPKNVIVHQEDMAASLVILIRKMNRLKSEGRREDLT